MVIKFLTLALFLSTFTSPAQAACENALRGIQVDSSFIMGQSWESTYFSITDHSLGAKSVVRVKLADCESDKCKQKLDLLENANWNHQLLKFSVDDHTCSHLWDYFIQNNGGGTADFLNVDQLSSVEVDTRYPF